MTKINLNLIKIKARLGIEKRSEAVRESKVHKRDA